MLRSLRIQNLAVIEAVEVELEPGFGVLTGETGAGKSILVEAVGLLLGGRASSDLVRTGADKATIEAIFERMPGDEVLIRREITSQGRSRSFVNGELATAAMLRDVSSDLVELHGQHEHQSLLDPATHLAFLDEDASVDELTAVVASRWQRVSELRERLAGVSMDARERAARLELVNFQLGEIDAVRPVAAEDEELEATRRVLVNAEHVDALCRGAYEALYDGEDAALVRLGAVWKKVEELSRVDPVFEPFLDARPGIKSQLEDLAAFMRRYADGIDASPARLREVDDRLVRLEHLKRKYGPTLDDVISRAGGLRGEAERLRGSSAAAGDIERDLAEASADYLTAATGLSRRRQDAAERFARGVVALLADLAMGGTRFEVRLRSHADAPDRWGPEGFDEAEFYVSPNPGEDLRPLARVASGGELSRIMLALRTRGARRADASGARKTLIFDEVDAGIGGRAADAVGALLLDLGQRFQVLCITHLAPIAARATSHFAVEKAAQGRRTTTAVSRLDRDGRVGELARMLAGGRASDLTRASALELLEGGGAKVKAKAKGESESRPARPSA